MQTLTQNKSDFYFANYIGITDIVDSDGNKTGEKRTEYSTPAISSAYISEGKGDVRQDIFGLDVKYSRIIVTTDDCGISETSILWIDRTPADGEHNYIVKAVAKSLNQTVIAISEVKVS